MGSFPAGHHRRAVEAGPEPVLVLHPHLQLRRAKEGFIAPDIPQATASSQGLVSSWPPTGLFPWLSLWAALDLHKTPSWKFACCHEIMQTCSWGCLGNSSLCFLETWRERARQACAPSPAAHLRGQTPLNLTALGSDKCRDTKGASKALAMRLFGGQTLAYAPLVLVA